MRVRGEGEGEGWACMARVRAARVATSSVPTSAPISPLYLAYISPISPHLERTHLRAEHAPLHLVGVRVRAWVWVWVGVGVRARGHSTSRVRVRVRVRVPLHLGAPRGPARLVRVRG